MYRNKVFNKIAEIFTIDGLPKVNLNLKLKVSILPAVLKTAQILTSVSLNYSPRDLYTTTVIPSASS